MNNLLYLIAFLLVFAWAIGYYDYGAGPFIHSLLVLAAVVILARLSGSHIDHLFDVRHKKN